MALRDRLSGATEAVKRRLGGGEESRVEKPRRKARRQRLKQRARDAVPDAPEGMSNREVIEKARSAGGAAAERLSAGEVNEDGAGFGERPGDVAARAEHAATVADPVGATLEPASPTNVDDLARGRSARDDGGDAGEPAPFEDLLRFGTESEGGDDGGDQDPMQVEDGLEFDDPFGVTGGED